MWDNVEAYFQRKFAKWFDVGWQTVELFTLYFHIGMMMLGHFSILLFLDPREYPDFYIILVSLILCIITQYYFDKTRGSDAGYLTPQFQLEVTGRNSNLNVVHGDEEKEVIELVPFCNECNMVQPFRARHCVHCKRCVLRSDHHCSYIGVCIGNSNYYYYVFYLFWQSIDCAWNLFFAAQELYLYITEAKDTHTTLFYVYFLMYELSGLMSFGYAVYLLGMHVMKTQYNITSCEIREREYKTPKDFFTTLLDNPYRRDPFSNWNMMANCWREEYKAWYDFKDPLYSRWHLGSHHPEC